MAAGLFFKVLAPVFGMFGFLFGARMSVDQQMVEPGQAIEAVEAHQHEDLKVEVRIEGPDGVRIDPADIEVRIEEGGRVEVIPTEEEPAE